MILESGKAESKGNLAISCVGNTSPGNNSPVVSSVTVAGGYVLAPEGAVWVAGNGAVANVTGGVLEAKDNAVVAGNGTVNSDTDYGGTEINISGGQLVGHIQSSGYIACGVYHPQAGTLNITGGSIYVDGGVGVLMRAGTANITGGTIQTTGGKDVSGKVGDSGIISSCYGVFVEGKSGYPGAKTGGLSASVSGSAKVLTESADVPVLNLYNWEGSGVTSSLETTGGTFSNNPSNYVAEGYVATLGSDGTYVVATKPADTQSDDKGNSGSTQTSGVDVSNSKELAGDAVAAAEAVKSLGNVTVPTGSTSTSAKIGGTTVEVNSDQATKLNAVTEAANDEGATVDVNLVVKADTNVAADSAIAAKAEKSGAEVIPFELSVDMVTTVTKSGGDTVSASLPVVQTASAIQVTIKVDQNSIKGKRVSVARNHNNVVDILSADVVYETGAVTFSTDKFSSYGLVTVDANKSYNLSDYTEQSGSRKAIVNSDFGISDEYAFAGWYKDPGLTQAYASTDTTGTAYPAFVKVSDLITFKGGSLRMDGASGDHGKTSLRFGYEMKVPDGATLDASKWGWYAKNPSAPNAQSSFVKVGNYWLTDGNGAIANLVITPIYRSGAEGRYGTYGTNYEVTAQVGYTTADGTSVTAVDEMRTRSVEQVATAIIENTFASDAEKAYATGILGNSEAR